jgi:hypothetical protein
MHTPDFALQLFHCFINVLDCAIYTKRVLFALWQAVKVLLQEVFTTDIAHLGSFRVFWDGRAPQQRFAVLIS